MAKQEKKVDLGFDNAFQGIKEGSKKALTPLEAILAVCQLISDEIENIAKKAKTINIGSSGKINSESIRASNEANREALQLAKQREAAEKNLAKAQSLIEKARQEEIKAYEKFTNSLKKKQAAEARAEKQAENAAKKREAQYNKEIEQAMKLSRPYEQITAKVKELTDSQKQLGAAMLVLRQQGKEGSDEYNDLAAQFMATSEEAAKLRDDLRGIDQAARGGAERTKTLKQQLREMTNQLQLLEPGTQEFNDLANAAGALRDQIADTNAVINATAGSSVENLAAGLTGVANIGISAFQGLTSAQALFGVESEELEATLVKLNALAGLSDALKSLGGLRDQLTEIRAAFAAATQNSQLFNRANVAQAVATGQATTAQKILNSVMNANPIFLIVTAIGALVAGYLLYQNSVDDTIDVQKKLNETLEDYKKGATDAITKTSEVKNAFDLAKEGVISKEEALLTYNETLGDTYGKASDLNEAERLYNEKTDAYIIATAKRAQAQAIFAQAADEQVKGLTAGMESQIGLAGSFELALSTLSGNSSETFKRLQREGVKEVQDAANKRAKILNEIGLLLLKDAEKTENANGIKSESEQKSLENQKKRYDEAAKLAEENQKKLADYTKKAEDIEDKRIADKQESELAQLKRRYDRELSEITVQGEAANRLRIDLELQYQDDVREVTKKFEDENKKKGEDNLKKLKDALKKQDDERNQANEEALQREQERRDAEIEGVDLLEKQKRLILLQSGMTEAEIDKLSVKNHREALEEKIRLLELYGKDATDLKIELAEADRAVDAKRKEEVKETTRETVSAALDEYKKLSDAAIESIDERIGNEQKLQESLIEAANAGSLAAQQSIAASRDAERQATIEKQKEQRKQQVLEDIKTFYNLLNNNLDKGDSAAVAGGKALAQIGIIKGLAKALSSIKGFYSGTKGKLGEESAATRSGKDGHLIWADKDEMILNPIQTSKLEKAGIKTTAGAVQSAIAYQMMNPERVQFDLMNQNMRFEGATQVNMLDISPMLKKMDRLEKAIENIPTSRIDPVFVNGSLRGAVQIEKENGLEKHNIFTV